MLSTFFNKSKPINFIIIGIYMLILYVIANFKYNFALDYVFWIALVVGVISYISSMFVMHSLIQENDLTKKSTNTILLFAFFTVILQNALTNPYILMSNLFLILGIRKVIFLGEGKKTKATIYDASLWISLASLAYFWSIGFLLVLYIGILYFEAKNYRNWIIPILGVLTVYICANMFTLLFFDTFFNIKDYIEPMSLSYDDFLNRSTLLSRGTLLFFIVVFFSVYITKIKRKPVKTRPIFNLISVQLLVAIVVSIIVPQKNSAELIFVAAPMAIIGTTYLEIDQHPITKEINIWVLLGLPFIMLFF